MDFLTFSVSIQTTDMKLRLTLLSFCLFGVGIFSHAQQKSKEAASKPQAIKQYDKDGNLLPPPPPPPPRPAGKARMNAGHDVPPPPPPPKEPRPGTKQAPDLPPPPPPPIERKEHRSKSHTQKPEEPKQKPIDPSAPPAPDVRS